MDFKLPDIGEGVHEGEITRWLVKAGDSIAADQPMVEVMTDKATVEIPSPVDGVVEQLMVKEGETVQVGKVLIKIKESGKVAAAQEPPKAQQPKAEQSTQAVEPAPSQAEKLEPVEPDVPYTVLATPATRKLARELSVNLGDMRGTGPAGRITKIDVQMAYESRQASAPRPSHPVPFDKLVPAVQQGTIQRIPLRGIRKKIAESMTRSKRTAAHFTYVEEVDMTEIVNLRNQALKEAADRGVKLTFLPFIIKCLIPALREFPFLNASLDDERQEILLKGDYHIGIATDTENGLVVPVVKSADKKTLWALASEIAALAEKARSGKLAPDDMKGGTFTVTNAGSIGGAFATPVINYPEVAILGINAIRKKPVVKETEKEDEVVVRHMMFLSLSVDHRVVDGAVAARFVNRIVYFLSNPSRLVFL
ncbi:MAG: 2-oxo acid dehydrogenase subunit E2 [Deltaproteobacteria bacterium]|nr:2-oxo acid dehydrogenase subunit E2 [Deltaproteobacteria bacterium]